MVCNYNNVIAMKHGINTALVMGYINFCLNDPTLVVDDQPWIRITNEMFIAVFPFMG